MLLIRRRILDAVVFFLDVVVIKNVEKGTHWNKGPGDYGVKKFCGNRKNVLILSL